MVRNFVLLTIGFPAVFLALAVLSSYFGAFHPLGDSLAVFRPHATLALGACALALLALRAWRGAALSLTLALAAGVPVLAAALPTPAPADPDMRVYAKNVLFGRGDNAALLADIRATGADLILLQELNATRGEILEGLADSHPHRHICQFSDWSGIAILSRWPLSEPHCSAHRTLAAARVGTPDGPVWAISTHLQWPFPFDQRHALDHEMDFLRGLDGPVIVGGDFNMAPWGQSVQDMADATGAALLGPIHVTITPRGIPLSIDHILTTGEGMTDRRPRLGSDHFGLLAEITL